MYLEEREGKIAVIFDDTEQHYEIGVQIATNEQRVRQLARGLMYEYTPGKMITPYQHTCFILAVLTKERQSHRDHRVSDGKL